MGILQILTITTFGFMGYCYNPVIIRPSAIQRKVVPQANLLSQAVLAKPVERPEGTVQVPILSVPVQVPVITKPSALVGIIVAQNSGNLPTVKSPTPAKEPLPLASIHGSIPLFGQTVRLL